MIKQLNRVNRLRLTFRADSQAYEFYMHLARFASVKRPEPGESAPPDSKIDEKLEHVLNSIRAGTLPPPRWSTEWPVTSLEGLVRLCLTDPNFPGYVRKVHDVMKSLTVTDPEILSSIFGEKQ